MSERTSGLAESDAASIPLERVAEVAGRLERELAKVIIGQQRVIREILIAFLAGGHCLLRGVPGLAKTLLIKTLAEAVDSAVQPHSVHAGPDAVGHPRRRGHRGGSRHRQARHPLHPRARSSRTSSSPTRSTARRRRRRPRCSRRCRSIRSRSAACASSSSGRSSCSRRRTRSSRKGTYPLPEAQLDRFMFNVVIDYPSAEEERRILAGDDRAADPEIAVVATGAGDRAAARVVRARCRRPRTSSTTRSRLVRATRPRTGDGLAPEFVRTWVRWGAGPRAGQALLLGGEGARAARGPQRRRDRRRSRRRAAGAAPSRPRELPGRGRRHRRRSDRGAAARCRACLS